MKERNNAFYRNISAKKTALPSFPGGMAWNKALANAEKKMPLKTRPCFVQLFKLVYRSTKEEEEEKRNRLFRVPSDFRSTPFSCQISIPLLFIGDSMWTACEVWHSTVFVPRKKWTCLYYILAAQALTTFSRKTRRGVEFGAKIQQLLEFQIP